MFITSGKNHLEKNKDDDCANGATVGTRRLFVRTYGTTHLAHPGHGPEGPKRPPKHAQNSRRTGIWQLGSFFFLVMAEKAV